MTARLTLIAHAPTEALRHSAFPLDEPVPERELARVAKLNWIAPRAERILSAPERRARQTCDALGVQAAVADELRDFDYGAWRGRTMDEVYAEDPAGIAAWLRDPTAAPHGGESIEQVIHRVGVWMRELDGAGHVVAVTHAAVIRGALVHALQAPAQTFWRFDIAPLSLTDLRFARGVWTVRCVGARLQGQGVAGEAIE